MKMKFKFLASKFDLNELKAKWQHLQEMPQVFAYKLNAANGRYLAGSHQMYCEFNEERTKLRRPPHIIPHMDTAFDAERFNFTKVRRLECLGTIPYGDVAVSLIINNSPVSKYHTLLCPDVSKCHNQKVTLESLMFCVAFIRELNDVDCRLGYNSPGALASVNHLHYHLMQIATNLYVDQAMLQPLAGPNIYRLDESQPTEAVCFVIPKAEPAEDVDRVVRQLFAFLQWLCACNIPHNMFMTLDRQRREQSEAIKIFIYARGEYCVAKGTNKHPLGFLEFSGYWPIGDRSTYESLTESAIIDRLREETGSVYKDIYTHLMKEYS